MASHRIACPLATEIPFIGCLCVRVPRVPVCVACMHVCGLARSCVGVGVVFGTRDARGANKRLKNLLALACELSFFFHVWCASASSSRRPPFR